MSWTDLPTNYYDSTWQGNRKYTIKLVDGSTERTYTNSEIIDTTSYDPAPQGGNTSFYGANDANQTNDAINNIVSDFSDIFKYASDTKDDGHVTITAGTVFRFCNVNFPAGYNGLLIIKAVISTGSYGDARLYLGYGLDNADNTAYCQTSAVAQSSSDFYMNASEYIPYSSSDRTVHGSINSLQNVRFYSGEIKLMMFKNI